MSAINGPRAPCNCVVQAPIGAFLSQVVGVEEHEEHDRGESEQSYRPGVLDQREPIGGRRNWQQPPLRA